MRLRVEQLKLGDTVDSEVIELVSESEIDC